MKQNSNYEDLLLFKTAWYYYIENLTQKKISELLGISRMRVIKLLDKARQSGVIRFNIRKDSTFCIQAEQQLSSKFGLKDVFVVPSSIDSNQSAINESIAKAAAMYVADRLLENSFINIGYGDTARIFLNELTLAWDRPVSFVAMTGGVNNYLPAPNQPNIFNAHLYLIPAPLIMASKEMVAAIKEEEAVKQIYRMVKHSAYTIVGIGGLDDGATIFKSGLMHINDKLYLNMKGAVGDILSHFLDKDGNLVPSNFSDRLISTPLKTLQSLDNVIGVAAGAQKVDAIRAVLRGAYIDILITDEATANALLLS